MDTKQHWLVVVGLVLTCAGTARAQERALQGQPWDAAYVARVNDIATGVGLGADWGLWGQGFGHGLRADVSLHRHFGLRLRGVLAHGPSGASDFDPAMMGGMELFGRSAVIAGLLRLYGGGGCYVGGRPHPVAGGKETGFAGGGHMGIEVFASPHMSFTIEIGGQGGVHARSVDSGASVMGGVTYYL